MYQGIAWNLCQKPLAVVAEWLPSRLDFYLLSEVKSRQDAEDIARYLGTNYLLLYGSGKGNQELSIIFNRSLGLQKTQFLRSVNFLRVGRDPIYAEFDNFWIVVVHQARRNSIYRWAQAWVLKRWASRQSKPGLIAGDFNFDIRQSGETDRSFQILTTNGLTYAEPKKFVPTHCSHHRSILDGVLTWRLKAVVEVLFPQDDYCNMGVSDHRPVLFSFTTKGDLMSRSNGALLAQKDREIAQKNKMIADLQNALAAKKGETGEVELPAPQPLPRPYLQWADIGKAVLLAGAGALVWRLITTASLPSIPISLPAYSSPVIATALLKILLIFCALVIVGLLIGLAIDKLVSLLLDLRSKLVFLAIGTAIGAVILYWAALNTALF